MNNLLLDEFKQKSGAIAGSFRKEIAAIRSNRPHPAVVENIKVNCYEQTMPLKQVGTTTVEPPRELRVQVWDKSILPNVLKAIESSNVGSVTVEGDMVRIFLPELSEERRQELIKRVRQIAEKYRIQVRHERDGANKEVQRSFESQETNEDQKFKLKEEIQKQTDKVNEDIEKALEMKIKEISE